MKVGIYREDELEPTRCEECGSDNVLTAPLDCKTCAWWRELMEQPIKEIETQ